MVPHFTHSSIAQSTPANVSSTTNHPPWHTIAPSSARHLYSIQPWMLSYIPHPHPWCMWKKWENKMVTFFTFVLTLLPFTALSKPSNTCTINISTWKPRIFFYNYYYSFLLPYVQLNVMNEDTDYDALLALKTKNMHWETPLVITTETWLIPLNPFLQIWMVRLSYNKHSRSSHAT